LNKYKVLRIKITAPSAHFKISHSSDPRRTYPLPPYSTVIGLLANITGQRDLIGRMLSESFDLGVICNYRYLTKEYTWLRNMQANAHLHRFCLLSNRCVQERSEHPGGQSPVSIEVLNDVEVFIYLNHPDRKVLEFLVDNLDRPERWLTHLHLGRAEDWAMVEEKSIIELIVSNSGRDFSQAALFYQWLPVTDYGVGIKTILSKQEYQEFYNKIQGNAVLVTSIYNLVETPSQSPKKETIRNFRHVPARLCKSQVPFLDSLKLPHLLVDRDLGTPVYMCHIDPEKGVVHNA